MRTAAKFAPIAPTVFSPAHSGAGMWIGAISVMIGVGISLLFPPWASGIYILNLVTIFAFVCRPRKAADIFRLDTFTMIAFGVYTVPMVVFDIFDYNSGLVRDYAAYSHYLIFITTFLLAMCIVFRLPREPIRARADSSGSSVVVWDRIIAVVIALIAASVSLIVVPLMFGGYEVIATTARGQLQLVSPMVGFLTGFYYVSSFSILLLFNCVRNKKDWLLGFVIVLLLANLSFYLITGDRKFMVFYFVGLSFHFIRQGKLRFSQLLLITLAVFLALNAFRKIRDIRGEEIADYTDHVRNHFAVDWFSLRDSEFSAHFFVSEYVLTNDNEPPLLGFSYVAGFANLVPKMIWRDEQFTSLALTFATTYDGDYAARGGGYAYSFVLEAYQNFSYLGPAIVGALLGLFLKFVQITIVSHASPMAWTIQAVLLGLLVILPRTEFGSMLKQGVAVAAVPWLMYVIGRFFTSAVASQR